MLQAFAKLHAFVTDHVGQNEGCTSALALEGVNEDLSAAVKGLINESICDPEVLLRVLLWLIVQLQVEVLEVAIALRVRFASHVQDMRDASIYQIASLVCTLHWAHENALGYLNQANISEVNFASAEVHVREATAGYILLVVRVGLAVIILSSSVLLLVKRRTTVPGVPLNLLLKLGNGDSHWLLHLTVVDLLLTAVLLVDLVGLFLLATSVLVHATVLVHF